MAKVSTWPLNYRWAQETSNKISFTQTEISQGINYKGAVVSNQLNGVSHLLSQILQYHQVTTGYYSPTMMYHKGNFVNILHTSAEHPQQVETYICVNDNNGNGVSNRPPVLDATVTNVNGIDQYSYGVINSAYWKRVDVGASEEIVPIKIENATKVNEQQDSNQFFAKLMSIPDITFDPAGVKPERTKVIEASLRLTCGMEVQGVRRYCTTSFRIKGTYLRNDETGTYIKPRDYFNCPVPDIYVDEVIVHALNNEAEGKTYIASYSPRDITMMQTTRSNIPGIDFAQGKVTPYGFNFCVGYTQDQEGNRSWGIFVVSKESTFFELEGTSTIPVGLDQLSETVYTGVNVVPVRPKGGANAYGQLMELVEYDANQNNFKNTLLYHSRGQLELGEAGSYTPSKFSCLNIAARMQHSQKYTAKDHVARHTRRYGGDRWKDVQRTGEDYTPTSFSIVSENCYAGNNPGDLIEPGIPNITMTFYSTSQSSGVWPGGFTDGVSRPDGVKLGEAGWFENPDYNKWSYVDGSTVIIQRKSTQEYAGVLLPSTTIKWSYLDGSDPGHGLIPFDASYRSDLYKGICYYSLYNSPGGGNPTYSLGFRYRDVTAKSISVRRCIRLY